MKLGGRIRRTKAPDTSGYGEAFVFLVYGGHKTYMCPAAPVSMPANNRSVSSRLQS